MDSTNNPTITKLQAVLLLKEISDTIYFDLELAKNVFNPDFG
jgi:hypothetical protein